MKGDVQFTVFRHKRPREAVSTTSLSSFGSDASLNQSGVIAGVDAVVVEKPRHCYDGESIQVCILQGSRVNLLQNCKRVCWCCDGGVGGGGDYKMTELIMLL